MKEFEEEIESWELIPSDGGRFEVTLGGELVFSKLELGRHAEVEEIRVALRERLQQTG